MSDRDVEMSNKKFNWITVLAEILGVIALLFCMIAYLAAMGGHWISGIGIFLMPITVAAYVLFTWLSQNRATQKGYWIMYAAKFVFMIGLFLLSPFLIDILARLVNG